MKAKTKELGYESWSRFKLVIVIEAILRQMTGIEGSI